MLSAKVKSSQGLNRLCMMFADCTLQTAKLSIEWNWKYFNKGDVINNMTLFPSLSSLQAKLIFRTQNYIMLIPRSCWLFLLYHLIGQNIVGVSHKLDRESIATFHQQQPHSAPTHQIVMGPAIFWPTCFNKHYSAMHSWKGVKYPWSIVVDFGVTVLSNVLSAEIFIYRRPLFRQVLVGKATWLHQTTIIWEEKERILPEIWSQDNNY